MADNDVRRTEHGHAIDAAIERGFIRTALEHDAVADAVHDLLFEHVVEGRYHPTVEAASLRPMLIDTLDAASEHDWRHVADELIAEARDALAEAQPRDPDARLRLRSWRRRRSR